MSDIENLSGKKLFRIKSESIVDFLKEKVRLEECKSIEIFGGEGVNDSIFSTVHYNHEFKLLDIK